MDFYFMLLNVLLRLFTIFASGFEQSIPKTYD